MIDKLHDRKHQVVSLWNLPPHSVLYLLQRPTVRRLQREGIQPLFVRASTQIAGLSSLEV